MHQRNELFIRTLSMLTQNHCLSELFLWWEILGAGQLLCYACIHVVHVATTCTMTQYPLILSHGNSPE